MAGPLTTYLPPGTVGQWPPAAGQWWNQQKGGDPRTDQAKKGDDSDPWLATQRDSFLTATRVKEVLSKQRG